MILPPATAGIAFVVMSAATPALRAQVAAPAQPKILKFAISEGHRPGGKTGYTGTVTFSRRETTHGFSVAWQLADGTTLSGFAVPYPDSGVIAVGYGEDLTGVAIYKKDGGKGDLRWSPALPDSAIGAYQLSQGDTPNVMKVENHGGILTFMAAAEQTGTAEFKLTTGASSGITISQGNFTAIASGGSRTGVVIYKKTGAGAEGRWTVAGTPGAGTENLTILEVDGKKIDAAGTPPLQPSASGAATAK